MQYKTGLTLSIPPAVRDIRDSFSKELVDLWTSRKLQGKVYTVWNYTIPMAYCLLETNGKECTIRGLFVQEIFRGQGIGSNLLKQVCTLCDGECRKVILVNITKGAEKVYLREGFKIIGERKDFSDQILAYRGVLSSSQEQTLKSKCVFQKTFKL